MAISRSRITARESISVPRLAHVAIRNSRKKVATTAIPAAVLLLSGR
jgi:hypothetical protein